MDSCCGTNSCGDSSSCNNVDVFATSGTFGDASAQEEPEPVETPVIESRDLSYECKFPLSFVLQLPKFSKGYKPEFFEEFIASNVGDDFVALGRLSYPNEWQVVVKTKAVRERMLRIRRTKINGRTCWIKPLSTAEVRGNLHWLPMEVPDSDLIPVLQEYGEILFLESDFGRKDGIADMRRFSLFLKKGLTKYHIPHYLKVGSCRALITIQGREPMCFHCKDIGHRKSDCIKHQLRMHDMGNGSGENAAKKRTKPRGKRHKVNAAAAASDKNSESIANATNDGAKQPSGRKRGKAKKAGSVVSGVNAPLLQSDASCEMQNVDSGQQSNISEMQKLDLGSQSVDASSEKQNVKSGSDQATGSNPANSATANLPDKLDNIAKELSENLHTGLNLLLKQMSLSTVPVEPTSQGSKSTDKNVGTATPKVADAESQQGIVEVANEAVAPKTSKNKKKKKKKH